MRSIANAQDVELIQSNGNLHPLYVVENGNVVEKSKIQHNIVLDTYMCGEMEHWTPELDAEDFSGIEAGQKVTLPDHVGVDEASGDGNGWVFMGWVNRYGSNEIFAPR